MVFRNHGGKDPFNFFRIPRRCPTETLADARHMSVYKDGRSVECLGKDDAGGFASYSRKCDKLFHAGGNLPGEPLQQLFGKQADMVGLSFEKTGRSQNGLESLGIGFRKIFWSRIP